MVTSLWAAMRAMRTTSLRGGRVADNVIESIDGLGPGDAHGGFLDPFGLAQGQHPAFPRFQAGERKHAVERTALELEERFLIAELAAFREDRPDDVAGKDDVLNIAVHSVRRQVEHGLRLVVQRPYRAVAFQHDHPFIQHFNDGLLFLKEQPQAELFRDGVGRRFHHTPGMVMVQGARERHIEYADDGVPAVPDGGRRAEPAVERAAVMFRSQRLHRRMFHEARPDGIGPRGAFRREVAGARCGIGVAPVLSQSACRTIPCASDREMKLREVLMGLYSFSMMLLATATRSAFRSSSFSSAAGLRDTLEALSGLTP